MAYKLSIGSPFSRKKKKKNTNFTISKRNNLFVRYACVEMGNLVKTSSSNQAVEKIKKKTNKNPHQKSLVRRKCIAGRPCTGLSGANTFIMIIITIIVHVLNAVREWKSAARRRRWRRARAGFSVSAGGAPRTLVRRGFPLNFGRGCRES